MLCEPIGGKGPVEFISSPTAVPVPGGAVGNAWTVPILIILGVAVLATVALFLWSHRERA
jgi:hypothetical protein